MAWRNHGRGGGEKAPPVAFPGSRRNDQVWAIRRVITQLEMKQIKLSLQPFDAEELKLLFVEPCWRQTLTDAYSLVEPAGTTQELHVNIDRPLYTSDPNVTPHAPIRLTFTWHHHDCGNCFYVPHKAGASSSTAVRPRDDAPRELLEKFDQVCTDLIDVHWRFSQVAKVFTLLNNTNVCRTPAQMRYVWPCIYTLANLAKLEVAESIASPSALAGKNVVVPSDVLQMLQPTNDTIARAMFLNDVEPSTTIPIHYIMAHGFETS